MTGSATASATAPSPEPSTMPTRGAREPSLGLQKGGSFRDLVVVGHRKEQAVRFAIFYRFKTGRLAVQSSPRPSYP